jgi:ankyrin repeat protein
MSFNELYPEFKKYVFTFLDIESLVRMCQVSKEMKGLICDETKNLLVEAYINNKITRDLEDLFFECCKKGGPIIVISYLIKNQYIDPSDGGNYAIKCASQNGHVEVVKLLLLDERVEPNAQHDYAIQYASRHGYTEIVKLLLNDPRINKVDTGNYAIRIASRNGHAEVVKLLKTRYRK